MPCHELTVRFIAHLFGNFIAKVTHAESLPISIPAGRVNGETAGLGWYRECVLAIKGGTTRDSPENALRNARNGLQIQTDKVLHLL